MRIQSAIIFMLLVIGAAPSQAADNYQIGDVLYVWAKSGLNQRETPQTISKVKTKLLYGSEVKVLAKTNISYSIRGINEVKFEHSGVSFPALVFEGEWVKIKNASGEIGYVIDQYLLKDKPIKLQESTYFQLNLKLTKTDTLFQKPNTGGESAYLKLEQAFAGKIELAQRISSIYVSKEYIFKDHSMEEIMILFSKSLNDYENFMVKENTDQKVYIFSEYPGYIDLVLTKEKDHIKVHLSASC